MVSKKQTKRVEAGPEKHPCHTRFTRTTGPQGASPAVAHEGKINIRSKDTRNHAPQVETPRMTNVTRSPEAGKWIPHIPHSYLTHNKDENPYERVRIANKQN